MAKSKYSLLNPARIIVSVLLIAMILWIVSPEKVAEAFLGFNALYLVPVILLMAVIILLNCSAVFLLVRSEKKIRFSFFLKKYFYSWCLGYLFPGKMGDFSLAFFLKKEIDYGATTAIVLIDKAVTLAVFLSLSILLFLQLGMLEYAQAVFSLAILILLGSALALSRPGRNFFRGILKRFWNEPLKGFSRTLKGFAGKKRVVAANLLLTLARIAVMGISVSLLLEGFGENVLWINIILVNSASMVLSLVPVTFNGLGIREGSFIFLTSLFGISRAAALGAMAVSLFLNYSIVLFAFFIAIKKTLPGYPRKSNGTKRSSEKEKLMLSCGVINEKDEQLRSVLELTEKKDGRIIGIAGISIRHSVLPALYLAVDKKHRGMGLGTKLTKRVLAEKKGILFLTVATDNKPAKKIYRKCGFIRLIPWRKIRGRPHELMLHF